MRFASLIISLCLHAGVFLLIWFWPAQPPIRLDAPPITISLVAGDFGGNQMPSPILGHVGDMSENEKAPQPPAPQSEVAATERPAQAIPEPAPETVPAEPIPVKPQPLPEPVPVPEKKPEPEKPEPVKVEEKKPEPPKEQPKKPEPKKPEKPKEPPKKPAPKKPKPDPIAAALAKARKATSRTQQQETGSAVERALAQARQKAGGTSGGGGGSGEGAGGGGLGDVYIGQVMLAVRPNWGFASSARVSLVCVIKVNVDMQGKVQSAVISQSSGNAQYDASAVNAIVRTSQAGDFPPPPNPQYMDLDLVFTLDELRAR